MLLAGFPSHIHNSIHNSNIHTNEVYHGMFTENIPLTCIGTGTNEFHYIKYYDHKCAAIKSETTENHGLISVCTSKYIYYKALDEITYPFIRSCTVVFWKRKSNFTSHFIGDVITYTFWE